MYLLRITVVNVFKGKFRFQIGGTTKNREFVSQTNQNDAMF